MSTPGIPLGPGTDPEFEQVASFLGAVGFLAPDLCGQLGIPSIGQLGHVAWDKIPWSGMHRGLAAAAQLFLRGASLPAAEVGAAFGEHAFDAARSLQLLVPTRGRPDEVHCPVMLYPVSGFLIASDRVTEPDGSERRMPPDAVFPALYPGTLRFLSLLPETDADALDLCGGTGIGALVLSASARTAVTSDLTARATAFARFNARLNSRPRVEAVEGAGYDAVRGRRFGLVTAHPPYMPSIGDGAIFRDGGSLGEDVTRAVIEGLPDHLLPGGSALVVCLGRATRSQPWEQRARDWLGPASSGFDLLLAVIDRREPGDVAADIVRRAMGSSPIGADEMRAHFLRHETAEFVYGALLLIRHESPREPITHVVNLAAEGEGSDLEARLHWLIRSRSPGWEGAMSALRPSLAEGLELELRHVAAAGRFGPGLCTLRIARPFVAETQVDSWMIPQIGCFDGSIAVGERYEIAKAAGELPPNLGLIDWLRLVRAFVDRGYLVPGQRR